jgi:hypothetical protein
VGSPNQVRFLQTEDERQVPFLFFRSNFVLRFVQAGVSSSPEHHHNTLLNYPITELLLAPQFISSGPPLLATTFLFGFFESPQLTAVWATLLHHNLVPVHCVTRLPRASSPTISLPCPQRQNTNVSLAVLLLAGLGVPRQSLFRRSRDKATCAMMARGFRPPIISSGPLEGKFFLFGVFVLRFLGGVWALLLRHNHDTALLLRACASSHHQRIPWLASS